MMYGYVGRILHVDLTQMKTTIETPSEDFYRRYLGGSAMNLHYLLRDMPDEIDAFDPQNMLALSVGVLTGTPFSGQSRMSVNAKSPLTDAIGDSQSGGFWPAELKFAGFDGIVIKGRAATPVYLWIREGKCEIRDAAHLWGRQTGEVEAAIKTEHGDPKIKVLQIGPAGERKVRFACLINHCNRANGRTGMGAVMGSKRLKAIAVRGSWKPRVADPKGFRALIQKYAQTYRESTFTGFGKYGTGRTIGSFQAAGALPTRNFTSAEFDSWQNIDGMTMYDTLLKGCDTGNQHREGRDTCYGCVVRCKRKVEIKTGDYQVNPTYGGPEYETLATFGSYCGIDDLQAICKANEICNRYGMDTISCGAGIAWAMEAFEKGELTEQDTDGIQLRFGDARAMLQMLERIANREGFGKLLGEGSARAAYRLGKGESALVTCKNQELPAHMPHLKRSLALVYAVNPFGADHQSHEHDGACGVGFENYKHKLEPLGIHQPVAADSLGSDKIRFIRKTQCLYSMLDSLCLCQFVWGAGWQLLGPNDILDVTRTVTGWDITMEELLTVGERRVNMMRVFNARQGIDSSKDQLPKKLLTSPIKGGSAAGWVMDQAQFETARGEYYRQCGWDPQTGIPTTETLSRLGIK